MHMVLILLLVLCRMSAAAYLASYLSRAKFLSVSFVIKILQRLPISSISTWCWFLLIEIRKRKSDSDDMLLLFSFIITFWVGFRLVSWCWKYTEDEVSDISPKAHRVFYSGCQVYYALIFSWERKTEIAMLHKYWDGIFWLIEILRVFKWNY